ncbi:MAG: Fmu (Sun) domain protein [Chitinophagaceae bacterium]|nr:MAG: Fmu (Sun) domain protein [Chitinophagaceae bacterium]
MNIPQPLIDSLAGVTGFERDAFLRVHHSGEQVTSVRLNPLKPVEAFPKFENAASVPWSIYGRYLGKRPSFTFDPLFHAGTYYVQEASSMFLEQAIRQTTDLSRPLRVLDLSAAPGGKSTHLQSLISDASLLVSNEVIRTRANILKDNIIRWGGDNVVVSHNDPADFGRLENFFDIIVVDAPCSGSGLFRREPEAIEEWSEQNVILCAQRQQRILADIFPALKNDGLLVYSTCSYSPAEDESILDWYTRDFDLSTIRLDKTDDWNITETTTGSGAFGYRFWPYKTKGEGFFLAAFRKNSGAAEPYAKTRKKIAGLTEREKTAVGRWMDHSPFELVRHEQTIYAWPLELSSDMNLLLNNLRVIYSGILLGELKHDKLVPDHALALSTKTADDITRVELSYDDAIRFLQRKEFSMPDAAKGWSVMTFSRQPIGWANILPNRINNYYPKELRILKEKE